VRVTEQVYYINMKAKIILFILLLFSQFIFSEEQIEFNIGFEYNNSRYTKIDSNAAELNSLSFGFLGIHSFNDKIGILLNLNLNLPLLQINRFGDNKYSTNRGDYDFWLGIDGLIATTFKTNNFPIAIGLHFFNMKTAIINYGNSSILLLGLGMNYGHEFLLTSNIFIVIRFSIYFDFFSNKNEQNVYQFFNDKTHFDIINFGITPMIGIGYKL